MLHYAHVKHNIPGNKTYFTKLVLQDLGKKKTSYRLGSWSAQLLPHLMKRSYCQQLGC